MLLFTVIHICINTDKYKPIISMPTPLRSTKPKYLVNYFYGNLATFKT